MLISKILSLNAIESVDDMILLEKYRAMFDLARSGAKAPSSEDRKILIDGYGGSEGLSLYNDLVKRFKSATREIPVGKKGNKKRKAGVRDSERDSYIKERMDTLDKTLKDLEKTDKLSEETRASYAKLGPVLSKWLYESGSIAARKSLRGASGLQSSDRDFLFNEITSIIVEKMADFLTNKSAVVNSVKDELTEGVDVVESGHLTSVDKYMRDKLRAPVRPKDPTKQNNSSVKKSYDIHIGALKNKLKSYTPGDTFKYDFKNHSFILDSRQAIQDAIDILEEERDEFSTTPSGEKRFGAKYGYGVTVSEEDMDVIIDNLFELFKDGIDLWYFSGKNYEDPYFRKDIGEMSGVAACGVSLQDLVLNIASKVYWRGVDIGKKIINDYTKELSEKADKFKPIDAQPDDADELALFTENLSEEEQAQVDTISDVVKSWSGDRNDFDKIAELGSRILCDIGNIYDKFLAPVAEGGLSGDFDTTLDDDMGNGTGVYDLEDLFAYYACIDLHIKTPGNVVNTHINNLEKQVKKQADYLRKKLPKEDVDSFLNGFNKLKNLLLCKSCQGDGVSANKKCNDCSGTGFNNLPLTGGVYDKYVEYRGKYRYLKQSDIGDLLGNPKYLLYVFYKKILYDYVVKTEFLNNLRRGNEQVVFNALYFQLLQEKGNTQILKKILGKGFKKFYKKYTKNIERDREAGRYYTDQTKYWISPKKQTGASSILDRLSQFSDERQVQLRDQIISISRSNWEAFVNNQVKPVSSESSIRASYSNFDLISKVRFFKQLFELINPTESSIIHESSIVDEILDSYLDKMEFISSDNINDVAVSSEGREYSDMGRDKNDKLQNLLRGQFTSSHTMKDIWILSEDNTTISVNSSYKKKKD